MFIQENAFQNIVCEVVAILSRPQCVKTLTLDPPLSLLCSMKCHIGLDCVIKNLNKYFTVIIFKLMSKVIWNVYHSRHQEMHITWTPARVKSEWGKQSWNSAEHAKNLIRPTKFELKPVSGLSANEQKLLDQSEARKWQEFSRVSPKIK